MATVPAVKQFSDRVNRIEISATMAVVAEAAKLKANGADLVEFGAGEPHFPTPQHIKDAAIAAIQNNCTRYTAVAGIQELRNAIPRRHAADFGSMYQPADCMVSTGGKLALFNALQVLVDHGDEVIVPVPYWVSFKDIIEYAGGKCVFAETDEAENFRLTPEMIERQITPRTRAIIINTPNNPSGAVLDPADFTEILRLAHKRGIYLIADECYVYLNFTPRRFSAGSITDVKQHLVIVGSLSKTYAMTGWRLGYSVVPADIFPVISLFINNSVSSTATFTQRAAVEAFTKQTEVEVEKMVQEFLKRRDVFVDGLNSIPGIHCLSPHGAFYLFPNITALGKPSKEIADRLLTEGGVSALPGTAFGPHGEGYLRFSFANSLSNIEQAIERIRKFVGTL
jgi:aspartate aminotransferase